MLMCSACRAYSHLLACCMHAACIPPITSSMTVCYAQAAAAAAKPAKPAGPQLAADDEEDVDPNQYFERRVQHVAAEKSAGRNPYPHKFAVSHRIPDFIAEFSGLESGSQQQETNVSVAGIGVDPPSQPAQDRACSASTLVRRNCNRSGTNSTHWLRPL